MLLPLLFGFQSRRQVAASLQKMEKLGLLVVMEKEAPMQDHLEESRSNLNKLWAGQVHLKMLVEHCQLVQSRLELTVIHQV